MQRAPQRSSRVSVAGSHTRPQEGDGQGCREGCQGGEVHQCRYD